MRHRDRKNEFLAIPDCPVHAPLVHGVLAVLARDLRDLEAGGLAVERLLPYDFFPLTHHVEVLALLRRAGG